jgi:hypothetical protein
MDLQLHAARFGNYSRAMLDRNKRLRRLPGMLSAVETLNADLVGSSCPFNSLCSMR